jgi:hypothetical protein
LTIAGQTFTVSQAASADSPPTATLTTPANGAIVNGTASFAATASDDVGVTKVEFLLDGVVLTADPNSLGWFHNTAVLANGPTRLVVGYDTAGHVTTSAFITATVSNGVTTTPGQLQSVQARFSTVQVWANDVRADHSGNIIVVGYFRGSVDLGLGTVSSVGGSSMWDIFLAKYTAQGAPLWLKTLGNTRDDVAYSVAIDSKNDIIVTGCFSSTVDFGGTLLTSSGNLNIFVAKYSASGSHVWSKRFGGQGSDVGFACGGRERRCVSAARLGSASAISAVLVSLMRAPATLMSQSPNCGLLMVRRYGRSVGEAQPMTFLKA